MSKYSEGEQLADFFVSKLNEQKRSHQTQLQQQKRKHQKQLQQRQGYSEQVLLIAFCGGFLAAFLLIQLLDLLANSRQQEKEQANDAYMGYGYAGY